jgi:Na+-transporting NADH:ubiquinone oxidoreductase subunit NqrB
LVTKIASWKTMISVFAGGIITASLFKYAGMTPISWYYTWRLLFRRSFHGYRPCNQRTHRKG